MLERRYDVAILGAGPGGYPAAIRLAQSGKKVCLIEANQVGGTCLNRGCIPSKAFIAHSEMYHMVKKAKDYGISAENVSFDFSSWVQHKNRTVNGLRRSLEGLIASNQIDLIRGFGKFTSPNEIKVVGEDSCIILAQDIIIATGSEPKEISAFKFDGKYIHSSTSILDLEALPRKLIIVGGGVIGCEFASLYNDIGVEVQVVEALPSILPLECVSVSTFLTQAFKKRGIGVHTSSQVTSVTRSDTQIKVELQGGKVLEADMALIAIGRSLNSEGIGLENAGVKTVKGAITVNDKMETNVPGIYAIGDVTGKVLYAHVATHQGFIAASSILLENHRMNYDAIPGVIFTRPEIATIGMSLQEAQKRGYSAEQVRYPFQALGKAQAALQTDGFAQLVVDPKTGQIFGAQVAGYEAGLLIAPIATAITNELTCESIGDTIHAHPTLQEVWLESALIAEGKPLHFAPPIRKDRDETGRAV